MSGRSFPCFLEVSVLGYSYPPPLLPGQVQKGGLSPAPVLGSDRGLLPLLDRVVGAQVFQNRILKEGLFLVGMVSPAVLTSAPTAPARAL